LLKITNIVSGTASNAEGSPFIVLCEADPSQPVAALLDDHSADFG